MTADIIRTRAWKWVRLADIIIRLIRHRQNPANRDDCRDDLLSRSALNEHILVIKKVNKF